MYYFPCCGYVKVCGLLCKVTVWLITMMPAATADWKVGTVQRSLARGLLIGTMLDSTVPASSYVAGGISP
jgi:hypothetical protein